MPPTAEPPVAPPTPAPSPSPSPAPSPSVETPEREGSVESRMDKLFADDAPEPAKPIETPPPAAKPVEKPAAPPAKPAAAAPGADPYALPKDVGESKDLKRVRQFAYNQNKTAKTLEKELSEARTKLAELEGIVPRTKAEKDALAKKSEEAEKRIASYEERLQLTDFRQSDKYRTEFEAPYLKAFEKAQTEIGDFVVHIVPNQNDVDEATGQPRVVKRPGDEKDLLYILSMKRRQAREEAKKFFPEDWEDVMAHYDKIVPLRESITEAEKGYKEKFKSMQQEETARRSTEEGKIQTWWEQANENLVKANPIFAERKDDTEGNSLLKKGEEIADLFFSDERNKLPLPKRIMFDAQVRQRLIAFPRIARDLRTAESKIKQLEADITELRGGKPGAPSPTGGEHVQTDDDAAPTDSFTKKFGG